MAYASVNRAIGLSLGNRLQFWVDQVKENAAKRKVYKQTYLELSNLTNAELADIGLNRSVIRSVAREAAENT